ncbi:single-stranded DNA-binding protein [Micromonospora sp. NBC_01699]|uniref:single-stranded DNA-binding protein n=1 Tax=Micromonospora sp. NBC_01699 TaxID=2975984 RepID=UPI002E2A2391|nr:single-stranded DNA-binding protein [Micromonospora sp. NBC_01699]
MFDTYVTVVGNVLTAPEWRRTNQSGTLVTNFKVASTARRLDRESGRWVDGNSLRVRVNCWRKLAEGVASSVMTGDPIVVVGRMYTRDWVDDAGNHRTMYEMEAVAVGHDLSRGRGKFARNRPTMTTSSIEDAEAEQRVRGEETAPVPDAQAPARPDDRPLDDEPGYAPVPVSPAPGFTPGPGYGTGTGYEPDTGYGPGTGYPSDSGEAAGDGATQRFLTLRDELPSLPPADDPTGLPAEEAPAGELRDDDRPAGPTGDGFTGDERLLGGEPATGQGADDRSGSGRARRGRSRVPVPA